MAIQTQNPATGKVVKTFEAHTDAQVDLAIAKSVVAHEALREWPMETRAEHMRKAAKILRDEAEELGKIVTLEMGKTYKSAIAEVKKCADGADYYAEHAAKHLADEVVKTAASKSYRKYLPLGPVLAVMPWNYPIWQVIRFAAPALMAGNTGLLKHASNVPQCALHIENIFKRAGFPDGAFQTLLIGGAKVERILRDDRVRAATLTGSEPAGASVASICGQEIKPMKDDTDIGPLVNQDSLDTVTAQVENALKDGAIRVTGAEALGGDGFYFTPGILENIPENSDAYHEEIFAPVALLFKVESLDEAIKIANSSPFGLSSAIFTQDKDEQEAAINRLEAGGTFVNAMSGSNPHLPFGGIKRSGYGRELAVEGIRAFCNVKTVYIA